MLRRAANIYRTVDLESAPKGLILERLFDRFARDVADARAGILARDVPKKGAAIDHAMQIVCQLEAALDRTAAPELCANLAAVYNYVTQRLMKASLEMKTAPLDDVVRVMTPIADAFREAHRVVPR